MISKGSEIYVNQKWWFDVTDVKEGKVHCLVEYRESLDRKEKLYKTIKIDSDRLVEKGKNEYSIDEKWLRKEFGSLVDRLVKSKNVYSLLEDASANAGGGGMGSVSMAGLSGSPGMPGSAGSGDISGGLSLKPSTNMFPKGTYGISDLSRNLKTLKKLAKKGKVNHSGVLKTPLLDVLKEAAFGSASEDSENDFKRKLYDFLDYPFNCDGDLNVIRLVNDLREDFMSVSSERIKQYLKDLWTVNMSFIKKNCSDEFRNNLMLLGSIEG